MRKFLILLAKETRELITPQMLVPLVITVFVFMGIGKLMDSEQSKVQSGQVIGLIDRDHSVASAAVTTVLTKSNFKVQSYTGEPSAAIDKVKTENGVGVVVVPAGFQHGIQQGVVQSIGMYTITSNFSYSGAKSYATAKQGIAALNDYFSNQAIAVHIVGADPVVVKNPIKTRDYVIIGTRMAQTNPEAVMAFVSQQTTFIPIILFFVIVFASSLIATAIATEKENKTLETLLSTPVSRTAIVGAKMLAAGLVALLSSAVYMIGFRSYMQGISGGTGGSGQLGAAAAQLGLNFSPMMYVVLGIAMFTGILVALAIAMILGAFAEDVKNLQGLLTPLMVLVMVPYLLVLLLDIQTASPAVKWLVYAIPFSHSFMAAPNLFLHNYAAVGWGIVYQLVVLTVFLWIASRIFATDLIVTMKLNWGKKRR